MVLDERKNYLLQLIVEDYIATAVPVSSGQLVAKHDLDVSPATVRNDMVALEQEGFVASPHTSAGRIPTEQGYRLYVMSSSSSADKMNASKELNEAYAAVTDTREKMKNVARVLAELTNNAVIVGFSSNDVYYTGLSNLFSQPEFQDMRMIYSISEVVDQLDQTLPHIMASVKEDVHVQIGEENPVSDACSFIGFKPQHDQMIGLLGPMRMDYKLSIEQMRHVKNLLS